jgi:ubiquinone/menaquinone biosynthesis C-methylase UbiE
MNAKERISRECKTQPNAMSSYDEIASEYYLERHVTSRNFDAATSSSRSLVQKYMPPDGFVLDIGTGRGRVEEYFGINPSRIIEIDLSGKMLRLTPRGKNQERVQSDAFCLPFKPNSFSMVTAFLYDPYNKSQMYQEVSRVLSKSGIFIGTLPQFEWGRLLRNIRGYEFEVAQFVKTTGDRLRLNSYLMNDETLEKELKNANMEIVKAIDLCVPEKTKSISPDIIAPARLVGLDPKMLPIIRLFVASRS